MPYELIAPDAGTPPTGGYELIPPDQSASVAPDTDSGVMAVLKGLKRQALLGGRYVAEGLTGITDPINQLLGLPLASEVTKRKLTEAGLPEPETTAERIASAGSRGVVGASALPFGAAPALTGAAREILSSAPLLQLLSGGGAGAGEQWAREVGFGPAGQTAAGLAGGLVAPMGAAVGGETLGALARGAKTYFKPFTAGGQRDVVGSLINRFAENPQAALSNIESAPEFVPGSNPTTATASADPGLLALQRGLMNEPESAPMFTRQAAEANAARLEALGKISGDSQTLAAAKTARDMEASKLYGLATGADLNFTAPQAKQLFALLQRPSMKAAMTAADRLAAEDGVSLAQQQLNDPTWLHYVKKGLDDVIDRAPTEGMGPMTRRAMMSTKDAFLDFLDDVNPAYKTAREAYASASQPISQMETLQDIGARAQLAVPDVLKNPVLSQAKWKQLTATPQSLGDLARVLTQPQMDTLQAIGSDLNREALTGSVGKAVGSNTMQNLAMSNLLAQALGRGSGTNPIARLVSYPLSMPYKWSGSEQQIQDLLDQAMLNPRLGAELMRAVPPGPMRDSLAAILQQAGRGATLGTLATVPAESARQ